MAAGTGTDTTSTLHAALSPGWAADAPPAAPAVLLLMHGFGSNERDLAELGPVLADGQPADLPWASLRAPHSMPRGGHAWFPIVVPGEPEPGPLAFATDAVWRWVDAHLAPRTRIIAAGFSQGGLMATQLLRTRPERVAATVVLSGFVLAAAQAADERLAADRPAVFWGRGSADRVITAAAVDRTSQWLPAHSALVERVYPGLAHGVNGEEIADIRSFLAARLAAEAGR